MSTYFNVQRYVFLLFDEMKVQANLVLDKDIGELVEFTDLGDSELNIAVLDNARLSRCQEFDRISGEEKALPHTLLIYSW